jgi:hypothetical protein
MTNNHIGKLLFSSLLILFFASCETTNPNFQEDAKNADFYHRSMKKLTDVIVHDIFSPPVASRIYAYPNIAAFEVMVHDNPDYQSLGNQLGDLENVPQPEEGKEYCFSLAGIHAFLLTGKALIFSEAKIEEFENEIYDEFKAIKIPQDVYDRSMDFGKAVSDHILAWADNDMYKETRSYPKYSIPEDPSKWKPTPPDYMDGIEPAWNVIRTMVIDSANQFSPPPPTQFSIDKNSQFYKETMEVYDVVKNVDEEKVAIAEFWDCNPFVSHHKGHVMFATKKITPGGHWMGIAYIASKNSNANIMKTSETYTRVAISLFDAFISCWDEKYRSNLVRPETVINTYIDESWLPILQTPPFPEHTSGHSVASGAAAVALTTLYGDNFVFVDSTEVEYGLPPRSFTSFFHASDEASISRLYGGIHYKPAIDYGVTQGRALGKLIADRVKTRK